MTGSAGSRNRPARVVGMPALGIGFIAVSLSLWAGATHAADCVPVLASVVQVKGQVEFVRQGTTQLVAADASLGLCAGDTVLVHSRSQAALLLANATVVRLDQGTTVTLSPASGERATLLNVVSGAIYVISRTPRPFRVKTPFINANVEGTEFLVEARRRLDIADDPACAREPNEAGSVQDADRVTVFEGVVRTSNEAETVTLTLAAGDSAVATATSGPTRALIARPRDAVNWTLYVPPVIGTTQPYPGAVTCAARLASLGNLDEAKRRLDKALTGTSALSGAEASRANALLATIAVAENEREKARRFADLAIAQDANSAESWVALSYVQQAAFQIQDALASVSKAVAISPDADRKARLAELQMATGDVDAALVSATEVARSNPGLARAQTVLGFVHLSRIETRQAKEAFAKSIQIDNADPLARLGLGLAKIREGNLPEGREEIEVAAVLDTESSLIRSYLGKAYFEEKRDGLAEPQFRMAKEFDPHDPTPWFYSAILMQSTNRPIEALRDLHTSIELNDNRAVYRSRLLMDDDKAARTTSLAATYAELGFDRLSIGESVKALSENLGNDAAHRQLASAYANQPRHSIARTSEALQAQIRQPLTVSPIDPEISTDNLGLLRGNGPSRLGQNEFNQLFSGDQIRLQADGIAGSRGTFGDQVVVSGMSGKLAYAASQLHYQTDGFRDNNEAKKNAEDIFIQGQLTPHASLQLEVKRADFKLVQTFFAFDPIVVLPLTIKERSDLLRINGHYDAGTSDWIFSANDEHRIRRIDNVPDGSPVTETRAHTRSLGLQYLYRSERIQWIVGAEGLLEEDHLPIEGVDITERSQTAYAYGLWRSAQGGLSVQFGAAVERLKIGNPFFTEQTERHRLSPKLGIVWSPSADTTLRAAAFSAVKRPFIASQTLELTQIAGFNQFFTGFDALYGDTDGTISKRAGLGIDQRLGKERYVGAEISARRLDVPSLAAGQDFRWKESGAHLYFYDANLGQWFASAMPGWTLATSLEYEVERLVRPQVDPGPEGFVHITTQRLPIAVRAYRGDATVSAVITRIRQTGVLSAGNGLDSFPTSTNAWTADLSSEFHFPRRLGSISIGVRNVFNRRLDIFQSDPFTLRDAQGRFVYAKVRLIF